MNDIELHLLRGSVDALRAELAELRAACAKEGIVTDSEKKRIADEKAAAAEAAKAAKAGAPERDK